MQLQRYILYLAHIALFCTTFTVVSRTRASKDAIPCDFSGIHGSGIINCNLSKWFRTEEKWIVDSQGNRTIFKGANFVGYGWEDWKSHTLEDYERMKSWGFNVVRLPIGWNYIEPEPGAYSESYLAIVDKDVLWAKQVGIYLILDMHQTKWSPFFTFDPERRKREGMPIWLVSGYEDSLGGWQQAVTDFWLGEAPNGTEATPENPSMRDRYITIWKLVASRYANETTIIAYDLFNEPPRGGILRTSEVASYLYPFYERLMTEIRNIDSNHIIIYQPMPGDAGVKYARKLDFSNLVFSFHFYYFRENYWGNIADLEATFLKYRWEEPENNPIKNWSMPIWVGEFGSGLEEWTRDMVQIFDRYDLGWAWWSYYKSDKNSHVLLDSKGTERTYLTSYLKTTDS